MMLEGAAGEIRLLDFWKKRRAMPDEVEGKLP